MLRFPALKAATLDEYGVLSYGPVVLEVSVLVLDCAAPLAPEPTDRAMRGAATRLVTRDQTPWPLKLHRTGVGATSLPARRR